MECRPQQWTGAARRLDARRRNGRGWRPPRAADPLRRPLCRRDGARLRRGRCRVVSSLVNRALIAPAASATEAETDGSLIRPAAQIDLRSGEAVANGAFGGPVPDFAPDAQSAIGEPDAAENHRTGAGAVGDELVGEDRASAITEVDELTELAIAPVHHAQAGAEVR